VVAKRLAATCAGVALFLAAIAVALGFENPVQTPAVPGRTYQLFLALAALFPAGAAAYLAGKGQHRRAAIAALVAVALYSAIAAVALPELGLPVLALSVVALGYSLFGGSRPR
jgi:hypothetical protein